MPCKESGCIEAPYVCYGTPPLGLAACNAVICPKHGRNPEKCPYDEPEGCLFKEEDSEEDSD